MTTEARAHVMKLRFQVPEEPSRRHADADRRTAFWQQMLSAVPTPKSQDLPASAEAKLVRDAAVRIGAVDVPPKPASPDADVQLLEDMVKRRFGRALHAHLSAYAGSERLRGVVFRVDGIAYGSLEIFVLVEGISKLADAFDHDFDLFAPVLMQFAPLALRDALSPEVMEPVCELPDPAGMRQVIETQARSAPSATASSASVGPQAPAPVPTATRSPAGSAGAGDKAKWMWVVSNVSLIPAVGLASGFLYLGFMSLERDRDRIEAGRLALAKAQEERVSQVNAFAIEAVKAGVAPSRATSGPAGAGDTGSAKRTATSR